MVVNLTTRSARHLISSLKQYHRKFPLSNRSVSSNFFAPSFCSVRNFSTVNGNQIMKGVLIEEFGGPEVLTVRDDLAEPQISTPTQVRVRVHRAGVNPVDTYIRQGVHAIKPKLPYTPGKDVAGVVESIGADVKSLKVGDRVFGTGCVSGAYAELAVFDQTTVYQLPDRLSFSQGAAFGIPYATALRALQKTSPKSDEIVLIHGSSGAVGLAAVELAKAKSFTVYGTAGSEQGMELVKERGADKVYCHSRSGYTDEILTDSSGGVDVILEMLANVNLQTDLKLMRIGGRTAIIGSRGPIEITPREMMVKESAIFGVALARMKPDDWIEFGREMAAGFNENRFNPVIRKEYEVDEVIDAHVDVIEQVGGAAGKLVIKFNE